MSEPRIGVVGATGAVGTVTLELLAERGLRARARVRELPLGREEFAYGSTHAQGGGGDARGARRRRAATCCSSRSEPTRAASSCRPPSESGALCIDKSDAFRLTDGVPLVVAGVNDDAIGDEPIVANPNCSAIQLTCVLKPLHDAAGLARVRLATYQSMSGAGDAGIERLRAVKPMEADLAMDWEFDGDESSEEWKLRAETRKILSLPDLPLQATCVRVPVLVGHAQAVWVETEEPLSPEAARRAPGRRAARRARRAPHAGRRRRTRHRPRGPGAPRSDDRARTRALGRERQPPQGRRAERDPDRRDAARPPATRRLVAAVTTQEELRRLYKEPKERTLRKELDHLDEHCRTSSRTRRSSSSRPRTSTERQTRRHEAASPAS